MDSKEHIFEGVIKSIAFCKAGETAKVPNHEAIQITVNIDEPQAFGERKLYVITDWLKIDNEEKYDFSWTRWSSLIGVTDAEEAKKLFTSKGAFDLIGKRVKLGCEQRGEFNGLPSFSLRRVTGVAASNTEEPAKCGIVPKEPTVSVNDDDIPF